MSTEANMGNVVRGALLALLGWLAGAGFVNGDVQAQWFYESPERLAVLVAAITELVKRYLVRLDGIWVVALSASLGVLLSWAGVQAQFLQGDFLGFGVMAGLLASGVVGVAKSMLGNVKLPANAQGVPSSDTPSERPNRNRL